jgi:ornithine cyclodeaminase
MRFYDAGAIRARLSWPRMLEALEEALRADVRAPLRVNHAIEVPGQPDASLLLMPAWRIGSRIGVKLVTVFPGNAQRGRRSVAAIYAMFDANDGTPLAVFDGEELTARRTAGASAYAASRLARRDAAHLVMVGAGRQSRGLIEAHMHIRPIKRVSIWSRTAEHAEAAADACARTGIPAQACTDLEPAVASAGIVSCATLATTPLVQGAWLRPGVHLDLVGAFKKEMRETDDGAMQKANLIVVDDRAAALAEGGDVVQAIASGAIDASRVTAELRDLACRRHPGRTGDDQITVFKSVGFALEDLAAATAVIDADVPAAA